MIEIRYRASTGQTKDELKAIRRRLGKDVGQIIGEIAEKHAVPIAKRLAPGIVAHTIVARGTSRGAYLTTSARGMDRRRFGLLEFGGSIRGTIPKQARRRKRGPSEDGSGFRRAQRPIPIRTPNGVIFRAYVRRPRHYTGKHFLGRAADRSRVKVIRAIERDVPRLIEKRLNGATPQD